MDIDYGLWYSASVAVAAQRQNPVWKFFDERLPFETMVEPEKYLLGKSFFELESNPLCGAQSATASFIANDSGEAIEKHLETFLEACLRSS